jgi:hypothetical protein
MTDRLRIAYRSDATGRTETYVEAVDPAPSSGPGKVMISKGSLGMPRFRQDGKEMYYMSSEGKMMAVPVTLGSTFHAGEPVPLFALPADPGPARPNGV